MAPNASLQIGCDSNTDSYGAVQAADEGHGTLTIKLNIDGFKAEDIIVTLVDNKLVLFSVSETEKEQNELNYVYRVPRNVDLFDAEADLSNNGDLSLCIPFPDSDFVELYIQEKCQVVLTRLLNNKPWNTKTLHTGGKRSAILNTIRTFSNLYSSDGERHTTTQR